MKPFNHDNSTIDQLESRLKLLKLMPVHDSSRCRCGAILNPFNGVFDCPSCINYYFTTEKEIQRVINDIEEKRKGKKQYEIIKL